MSNDFVWVKQIVDGREVSFQVTPSDSNRYKGGYRIGNSTEDGDVIILDGENVQIHEQFSEPRSIGISDDGFLVVADWIEYGEATGANILVLNALGEELYYRHIDGSSPIVDISPSGAYVIICAYEEPALIVDIESGDTRTIHDYSISSRLVPAFKSDNGVEVVSFSERSGDDPLYRIDLDGNIVWESETYTIRNYYETISLSHSLSWEPIIQKFAADYQGTDDELLQNVVANKIGDAHLVGASLSKLTEIIDAIKRYQSAFTAQPAHEKLIAQTLGDAQYRRAKAIVKKKGLSTESWEALESAGINYQKVVPWYNGKAGLAKVLRYQAKLYRKQGRHNEAFDCYQQIENLEKQHDIGLMSEADQRQLEQYREQKIARSEPTEFGRLV